MKNTIMHNGKRKTCRIFDFGEGVADRYTIAFRGYRHQWHGMIYPYIASGLEPYHPMSVGYHGESKEFMTGRHLGKRVTFASLPEPVQRFILDNI